MARILSGIPIRDKIARRLKAEVSRSRHVPVLAIIQIGDRKDSNLYIRSKKLFAGRIGVRVNHLRFAESASSKKIIAKINLLNRDTRTKGIIVQLPIPGRFKRDEIIEAIDPGKDVDGLTYRNAAKLAQGLDPLFIPATARGVFSLLRYYGISVAGKHIVVVGRSVLVGRPLAALFLVNDATVTICHRKTKDLPKVTKTADILVVAAGHPRLIGKKHLRRGQVVIDVGINIAAKKLEEEIDGLRLVGDVDFKAAKGIVRAISPVPGGVGPMTVASLFQNLIEGSGKTPIARK